MRFSELMRRLAPRFRGSCPASAMVVEYTQEEWRACCDWQPDAVDKVLGYYIYSPVPPIVDGHPCLVSAVVRPKILLDNPKSKSG